MAGLVAQFIPHAAQCFASGSANNLAVAVPVKEDHPFFSPLRQALRMVSVV
jgi:hypothetical protein